MNERLKILRERLGLTQKEIAEKIRISLRAWQNYELGLRKIPSEVIKALYEHLGINPTWLLTGKGPMFIEGKTTKVVDIKDIPKEQIKEFIEDFWQNADEKERHWFEVQFKKAFPEYSDWLQKKQPSQTDQNMKKGQSMT